MFLDEFRQVVQSTRCFIRLLLFIGMIPIDRVRNPNPRRAPTQERMVRTHIMTEISNRRVDSSQSHTDQEIPQKTMAAIEMPPIWFQAGDHRQKPATRLAFTLRSHPIESKPCFPASPATFPAQNVAKTSTLSSPLSLPNYPHTRPSVPPHDP